MIPRAAIAGWRETAPWRGDDQVEQDLIISRALVALFSDELLAETLAFRGGTALNKLFLPTASRYSEDIDLVQVHDRPIGEVMGRIRDRLVPWLGKAQYKQKEKSVTFRFRYDSEIPPVKAMRVKIEINTHEHFTVFGYEGRDFEVQSDWFTGKANIRTYATEELLGTKLRALYQRKKGRDLFDQWICHTALAPDPDKIVRSFSRYVEASGLRISRSEFEANLETKVVDPAFNADVLPLLREPDAYDFESALAYVREALVSRLR